jgi:ribonuclease T2
MAYGKNPLSDPYAKLMISRPDHCDGSYDSNCDPARNGVCGRTSGDVNVTCNPSYSNIGHILEQFWQFDLLEYMNIYWKGINGDESLWMHEWAKHGTCVSTLEPKCYGHRYKETEEVVDYFAKAVEVFQTLDTYIVMLL